MINKKTINFIIVFFVLAIQNLIIFWDHYFNHFTIPGDFARVYYALVAFWTTAIDSGVFPHWVPTAMMGFPFLLLVNSAFNYPFLWIFPLFGIQYTLSAAVIFQDIHILFGSIGMFVFLRYLLKNNKYALVGAVAFQLFGGFFSSSAFPDFIRFYALSPWMFYVFTLNLKKPTIERKILFIPIIIFLVITGGYAGTIISSIFMITIFMILQTIQSLLRKEMKWKYTKKVVIMFALLLIGVGISTIHLGPFLQYGDELTRFQDFKSIPHQTLDSVNLPSLFMPSKTGPEVGIKFFNSFYVTLPILILVCFTPFSAIKKYWIFGILAIIGILMAAGDKLPFYDVMGSLFSYLQLGKYPISDYKIFIIIPLILFAITGLKSIVERNLSWKEFAFRTGFVVSWFTLTIIYLYNARFTSVVFHRFLDNQIIFSVIIFCLTILAIVYFVKTNNNKLTSKKIFNIGLVSMIIFIALISFDGFRVISDMSHIWKEEPSGDWYTKRNIQIEKDGKLVAYTIFENLPKERPERETPGFLRWGGLINATYATEHFSNTQLVSHVIMYSEPVYFRYMEMKWTPIFLDPINFENKKVILDEETLSKTISDPQRSAIQTHYGINDIYYEISLEEPIIMLENEMYFPGWTATLIFPEKEVQLQAIEVNGVFRAWALPAGDYEMKANFQFPNYITYQIISISSFIIWVTILITFVFKNRNMKKSIDFTNSSTKPN